MFLGNVYVHSSVRREDLVCEGQILRIGTYTIADFRIPLTLNKPVL